MHDAGDRDAARARFQDARASFIALGAPRYAERADRLREGLDA